MMCPLFIYSTLDLLEFLNLSSISSGKFSSDTTSALPCSLSYLSGTLVLYMLNLYELSSIFLNCLTNFLLFYLRSTCWTVSSEKVNFFSYNVFISQTSICSA